MPMPRTAPRDNSLLITVGAGAAALVVGFAAAWLYQRHMVKLRSEPFFSKPVPVVTANSAHSVAATFAIRATGAEAGWVKKNQSALEQILKRTLTEADLDAAKGPQGLRALQGKLRDTLNQAMGTDNVKEVLITDFLVGDTSD
ncbi:flagellar basal body-associated FliL family protein [Oxalobacteraceae bacterium OM1]|nr:flagellar basal body-associated FliL family protein [Oxalobacteraceae bacterium OM1]